MQLLYRAVKCHVRARVTWQKIEPKLQERSLRRGMTLTRKCWHPKNSFFFVLENVAVKSVDGMTLTRSCWWKDFSFFFLENVAVKFVGWLWDDPNPKVLAWKFFFFVFLENNVVGITLSPLYPSIAGFKIYLFFFEKCCSWDHPTLFTKDSRSKSNQECILETKI